MPIYEYRCADCGQTFESIQKFSDEPFTNCGQSSFDCPTKGKGSVARQLTSPAFHFKGSGFYITDYNKGSGGAKTATSASTGDGNSESKSESKSDTKSETKSESKSESKTESKPAAASPAPAKSSKTDS